MGDRYEREGWRRDDGDDGDGRDGRGGGLLELLRRVVAPRQPSVLVMEPDGRLHRAPRADEPRE